MGNSQSSALEDAAKHDDLAKVRQYVSQNKLQMSGRDKVSGPDTAFALLRQVISSSSVALQDGWTPLHFASYWGSHRVMKELLQLGADTELEDFVSPCLISH